MRHVRVEVQHIPGAWLVVHDRRVGTSGNLRDRSRQIVDSQFGAAAEINRPADGCRGRSRQDDPARRVRDVREVARLRPIAEDDHRLAGKTSQEELRDHFPAVPFVMAARAIRVEWPHDDRRIPVRAVKGPGIGLARQL